MCIGDESLCNRGSHHDLRGSHDDDASSLRIYDMLLDLLESKRNQEKAPSKIVASFGEASSGYNPFVAQRVDDGAAWCQADVCSSPGKTLHIKAV